jgi:O-antigen ligase
VSGREELWSEILEKVAERPILGYGFYVAPQYFWRVTHGHNTYLNVTLGGGVVQLSLLILNLLVFFMSTVRVWLSRSILPRNAQVVAALSLVGVTQILARSVTEPSVEVYGFNSMAFVLSNIAMYRVAVLRGAEAHGGTSTCARKRVPISVATRI